MPDAGRGEPPAGRIVGADGRAKAYRPLPAPERRAALEAALAAYERGDYFAAHELLEPAWMGSPDPAERDLYQGLIKLAAAYVHAVRGNAVGTRKNLAGARRRLAALRERHGAAGELALRAARIDLEELLGHLDRALTPARGPAGAGPVEALAITRRPAGRGP